MNDKHNTYIGKQVL